MNDDPDPYFTEVSHRIINIFSPVDVTLDNDMTAVRQIYAIPPHALGVPHTMLNSPPELREPEFTPLTPFKFIP